MRSDHVVCLWIPLFPLRCEEERRPDLVDRPTAVLAPEDSRRVWQVSSLARRQGVQPGLTVSQAIGLCPTLALIEPDPVFYDEQFARLLMRLENVSPVIEPAELGRVYVGVDGLEGLYGDPRRQLEIVEEAAVPHHPDPTPPAARRSAWVGLAESSPPGSPPREQRQAILSSSPMGSGAAFSAPNPLPHCRSIPTTTAGSSSSV